MCECVSDVSSSDPILGPGSTLRGSSPRYLTISQSWSWWVGKYRTIVIQHCGTLTHSHILNPQGNFRDMGDHRVVSREVCSYYIEHMDRYMYMCNIYCSVTTLCIYYTAIQCVGMLWHVHHSCHTAIHSALFELFVCVFTCTIELISHLSSLSLSLSLCLRPEGAADVRYAEASMKNGFGLMHLHKFLSVPFLQLQVSQPHPQQHATYTWCLSCA